MKKLVILTCSALFFAFSVFVVRAATFQGPPSGCTNPTQTGCNLDGVIWNRATNAPQAQDASYYISGNTRTGGSARIGNGLQVDSGNATVAGEIFANFGNSGSEIKLSNIGDLAMKNEKAIRIDQQDGSGLNIGNWYDANSYIDVRIFGNLSILPHGGFGSPQISTPNLCLNGDCRDTWPSGGGGGGTVTSVGSGNGLTGGPITGSGTLNVGAGDGISVDTDQVGLDLSYTDGRYFVRDNQLDNNAGIYARTGILGSLDNSGGNSNYPYVNIGGGYIGYYENLGYWSVSPSILFRNSVSMLGGTVSIGQSAGHTLQIVGIVNGNTRYSVGGNNSSMCVSSGGTTCSTWSPTLGAVRGDQLCIGTDCRNAWPSSGGSGDITGVTASTGLSGGGASGDVTLSLAGSYSLPQSCGANSVPKWNGSAWVCATDIDTNSGGDITGVTAGSRLTGGGSSGAVTLSLQTCPNYNDMLRMNSTGGWECLSYIPGTGDITSVIAGNGLYYVSGNGTSGDVALGIGSGTGISVTGDNIALDGTYINAQFINDDVNETMTGNLYINNTTESSLTEHGALVLGNKTGGNMVLDGNEIQARNNGAATTLHLNANGGTVAMGYWAAVTVQVNGSTVHSSDRKLKKDITELSYGLREIMQLSPVDFKWKNGVDEKKHLGFIAQDVQPIMPELIFINPEKNILNLDYTGIIPVLVNATQEQQEMITDLQSQNDELRLKNEDLENRLERLESIHRYVK